MRTPQLLGRVPPVATAVRIAGVSMRTAASDSTAPAVALTVAGVWQPPSRSLTSRFTPHPPPRGPGGQAHDGEAVADSPR
jgi:hypothetical protein